MLFLEWNFRKRDFGPIANRIEDAKADFVRVGATGLEGNLLLDAMKKVGHPPPGPLRAPPEAKHALSTMPFEEQPPFPSATSAAEFNTPYREHATTAGLADCSDSWTARERLFPANR